MCLEIDKENYEKLDHIWLAKKQYLLKTTLFTSKILIFRNLTFQRCHVFTMAMVSGK